MGCQLLASNHHTLRIHHRMNLNQRNPSNRTITRTPRIATTAINPTIISNMFPLLSLAWMLTLIKSPLLNHCTEASQYYHRISNSTNLLLSFHMLVILHLQRSIHGAISSVVKVGFEYRYSTICTDSTLIVRGPAIEP